MSTRVEKTLDPIDAADEVTAYLNENFEFLPSVYVERAGVLRFLSGRGQWQVLDGIEAGVGLTGSAFAAGEPILVQDVSKDPRYREAVPGVVAELAVPLIVERRIVGILNVDAPAAINGAQADAVRAAVRVLEDAFARTGLSSSRGSPLVDFGWHAPRIAESTSMADLAAATVTASVAVARLQSAVLWTRMKGDLVQLGATGARADDIAGLTSDRARAAGRPGVARRLELQHRTRHQPDVRTDGATAGPGIRHRLRGGHPGPWGPLGTAGRGRTRRRHHRVGGRPGPRAPVCPDRRHPGAHRALLSPSGRRTPAL